MSEAEKQASEVLGAKQSSSDTVSWYKIDLFAVVSKLQGFKAFIFCMKAFWAAPHWEVPEPGYPAVCGISAGRRREGSWTWLPYMILFASRQSSENSTFSQADERSLEAFGAKSSSDTASWI